MLRFLAKLGLKLLGWRVTGVDPNPIPKKIFVVIPHTSNWDFVIGIMARQSWCIRANYLMKASWFRTPLAGLLRWSGGTPVDRGRSQHLVEQIVEIFQQRERFALAIAPEGTRGAVKQLKSGFYHIARQANIPLILVKMDYSLKCVDFGKPWYPSGDKKMDMEYIAHYFAGVIGRRPELGFGYNVPR